MYEMLALVCNLDSKACDEYQFHGLNFGSAVECIMSAPPTVAQMLQEKYGPDARFQIAKITCRPVTKGA